MQYYHIYLYVCAVCCIMYVRTYVHNTTQVGMYAGNTHTHLLLLPEYITKLQHTQVCMYLLYNYLYAQCTVYQIVVFCSFHSAYLYVSSLLLFILLLYICIRKIATCTVSTLYVHCQTNIQCVCKTEWTACVCLNACMSERDADT